MDEKKIQEIFADEAFVNAVTQMETAEEVQAALQEKGLELTVADVEKIREAVMAQAEDGELSDGDLGEVSGGFAITAALIGCIASCIGAAAGVTSMVHNVTNRRW